MKDHIWKIIGIVAVLSIGASILYSNAVSDNANQGIVFNENIKGNSNAAVTLTEYSDFQCPACGQFSGIVQKILEQYPNDVKLEYKHFPLVQIHPWAIPAAKAAEAAGQQGAFFKMHDKLFENQQKWSDSSNPTPYFLSYAEEIGLDMVLFKKHLKSSMITDKIAAELDEALALGLRGTPSFFLNGEKVQFQTYQDFIDQIETAIKQEVSDDVDLPLEAI